MLKEVLSFLKHPVYQIDENVDLKYRFGILLRLLGLALVISIVLGFLLGILESATDLDFGDHAIDQLIEKHSIAFIFLAAVVLAPLLEELFFRGPMVFFKKSSFFKYIFYFLTLAFGFYHITNFEITPTVLAFSILLVAPQLCVGILLGFIRVRLGLLWAMLLHACYNLILIGPLILFKILDIPIE